MKQILMSVDLIKDVIKIIESNYEAPALYKLSVINELKSALLDGINVQEQETSGSS
jgi:hypothetical protein